MGGRRHRIWNAQRTGDRQASCNRQRAKGAASLNMTSICEIEVEEPLEHSLSVAISSTPCVMINISARVSRDISRAALSKHFSIPKSSRYIYGAIPGVGPSGEE